MHDARSKRSLQSIDDADDGSVNTNALALSGSAAWPTQDAADLLIEAAELTPVPFRGSGLSGHAPGGDGTLSSTNRVTDETAAPSPPSAISESIARTAGNAASLSTDSGSQPTLFVDAGNPADVTFVVSGLASDYSGTVTFTNSAGKSDVVPIAGSGTYSANLSNLADGTLTYMMTVSDPAGNVIKVDPTATLGDGSANAPAGPAQLPNLLSGYAVRPPWEVAGVDYAVGPAAGTVFRTPTAANLPAGATLESWGIDVTGANVTLNGYDLSGMTVMIEASASGTITISNCTSGDPGTSVEIRSVTNATANLVVENCILNGGGTASDPNFQTIQVFCPLTAEYNYIYDSQGAIGVYGPSAVIQYNLLESFDYAAGTHANAIYISGGPITALVQYNTIWTGNTQSNGLPIGIGAAIGAFTDNGSISNTDINNNTIISSLPAGASYLIGFYTYSGANGYTASGTIENNYVASVNGFDNSNSGAFGALYPTYTNVTATISGNVDMATGDIVQSDNSEVAPSSPAAPVISTGVANSNESVTLTGTAPDGATVTVSDGGGKLGTATANSSTGAWSFTTADLAAGSYAFTATDTTSAGTSAASSAFDVTVTAPPPAAPVISTGVANSNESVTLTGTAPDGATVTVSDGGGKLGTTTANSSTGAWSFTTADLAAGSYAFTATDTTSAGTSAASSAFDVTVTAPLPAAPVISTGVANSNESVTLTGTAPDGATVTVSDGGGKLGTATAKQHRRLELHHGGLGGWLLRLHRDRYDVGGDQRSVQRVRCDRDGATACRSGHQHRRGQFQRVGDLDRNRTGWCHGDGVGWRRHARHRDRESSTGAWSFTTADLAAGSYAFTATDTTSAGTSAASSAFDVTVTSPPPDPPPRQSSAAAWPIPMSR